MFPFRLLSAILAARSDCTTPSMTVLALSQMRAADPQGGGLLAPWRLGRTYPPKAPFWMTSESATTRQDRLDRRTGMLLNSPSEWRSQLTRSCGSDHR